MMIALHACEESKDQKQYQLTSPRPSFCLNKKQVSAHASAQFSPTINVFGHFDPHPVEFSWSKTYSRLQGKKRPTGYFNVVILETGMDKISGSNNNK